MKKHRIMTAYVLILAVFTAYVIMDTFFITRVYGEQADGVTVQENESGAENSDASTEPGTSLNEYGDQSNEGDDQDTADDQNAGNMHSGDGSGHGRQGDGKEGSRHSGGRGPGRKHEGSRESSDGNGTEASKGAHSDASGSTSAGAGPVSSSDTYSDGNISITLQEYREYDSSIYVADVNLTSPDYLKTALAQGSYGRNVTQKTSEIAESVNAVLAINGDYYGAQEKGYVIRNGKLYRDTALANQEDLVIYKDGSFGIINESKVTASQLISDGAVQTLSFGPALVQNGEITVTENEEVGKAMASNPRTAIGIIDDNHYVLVVSDGRTDDSAGLSLYQLAQFMNSLGVTTAYNLDGGGSSTMYFNGKVVNNPTTGGSIRERSVSDIVYIGK